MSIMVLTLAFAPALFSAPAAAAAPQPPPASNPARDDFAPRPGTNRRGFFECHYANSRGRIFSSMTRNMTQSCRVARQKCRVQSQRAVAFTCHRVFPRW